MEAVGEACLGGYFFDAHAGVGHEHAGVIYPFSLDVLLQRESRLVLEKTGKGVGSHAGFVGQEVVGEVFFAMVFDIADRLGDTGVGGARFPQVLVDAQKHFAD